MKKLGLMVSTLLAAGVISISSAIAGIGDKVTGGAEEITAGGVTFSMTVNAIEMLDKDGYYKALKGSIQYSREDDNGDALIVHVPVSCLDIADDGMSAEIGGPATVHENTVGLEMKTHFIVAVEEGGTGSGDAVRARFADSAVCDGENRFPGDVIEGEFKIRPAN